MYILKDEVVESVIELLKEFGKEKKLGYEKVSELYKDTMYRLESLDKADRDLEQEKIVETSFSEICQSYETFLDKINTTIEHLTEENF